MRFCHHCGQALRGEERFCGACGRAAVPEAATTGPTGTAGADDETMSVPANPYADLDTEPAPPRGRRVALVSGAVAAIVLAGGVSAYALTRGSEPSGSAAPAATTSTATDASTSTAAPAMPATTMPATTTAAPAATTPAASATRAPTSATPQEPVTVTIPGARRTVTATPRPTAPPGGTDDDGDTPLVPGFTGPGADVPPYPLYSYHLVLASPEKTNTYAQARRFERGMSGVTTIDTNATKWLYPDLWAVVSTTSWPTEATAAAHCADYGRKAGGECYPRRVLTYRVKK